MERLCSCDEKDVAVLVELDVVVLFSVVVEKKKEFLLAKVGSFIPTIWHRGQYAIK